MDIAQAKKWVDDNRKDQEIGNDLVRIQIYALNGLNRVVAGIFNRAAREMPFEELEKIYEERLLTHFKETEEAGAHQD